jgi:hypothetical protein
VVGSNPSVRRTVVALLVTVVLLGRVGTGEARTAPVTPPPDGDPDGLDDALHLAAVVFEDCNGDFGYGKFGGVTARSTAIVPGVRAEDFDAVRLDGAVGSQIAATTTTLDGEDLLVELEVLDCRAAAFDVLSEFTPRAQASLAFLRGEDEVCAVELATPIWWREGDFFPPYWVLSYDGDGELTARSDFADAAAHQAAYTGLLDDAFGTAPERADFPDDETYLAAVSTWQAGLPRVACAGVTTEAAPHPVAVDCAPAVVAVGALVECSVTGGDPGIGILWRASDTDLLVEEGVFLDEDGYGSFAFRVPQGVGGGPLRIELVEWDRVAVVAVDVAAGPPVPARIPAGGGPSDGGPLAAVLVLLGATLAAVGVRRRSVG